MGLGLVPLVRVYTAQEMLLLLAIRDSPRVASPSAEFGVEGERLRVTRVRVNAITPLYFPTSAL
jgi:hypothetical protein